MDIIEMALKIPLVADQVVPKTALPKPALAALLTAFGKPFAGFDVAGEAAFDQSPTGRIIRIPRRQAQDAMQMFGQGNNAVNTERMFGFHRRESRPQHVNPVNQQAVLMALGQVDRKEPRCPRDVKTVV